MADNMCGPSNALQNFQKHSTVDRTLQQDRLVQRHPTSQGFRTSSANTGLLDPEFEAFQAGHLPFEAQGLRPHPQGFVEAPQTFQQPGASGWASDFQRLNISNPIPQLHQPFRSQGQNTKGWRQEFVRHQGDVAADRNMQLPAGQAGPSYRFSSMNGINMGGQHMGGQHMGGFTSAQAQSSSMAQERQQEDVFDEAAFARAFEEAAQLEDEVAQQGLEAEQDDSQVDGIQEAASQQQQGQLGEEILLDKSAERLLESEETLTTQGLIGADQIHHPSGTNWQTQHQPQDHDALARTASQLLDNVQDDQSSKFQNSNFLRLMRQLRDKEVTVKGDKIVGTNMGEDVDSPAPTEALEA
ncbi:uncharacterized protein BP5553_01736 [Venustampulla echinocandica]|uniref:Peroxin 20 n=1 Tax=Venustampulla echinocandica TaxID=2656787 RepID=A0A370U1V8_9HELO|nr:uncharacterized protein BP5553_01736 [Venustampulla echinocandica]RDL41757.1 hypothetical protein BP5553_01736 [Venustampulla echinocandica]